MITSENDLKLLDEVASAQIKNEAMFGDEEVDHSKADQILIELLKQLGFEKTVEAWEKVEKWYA